MKAIIKLVVTALIAYAGWNGAQAWMRYFKFKDAVTAASQSGFELTIEDLHDKVLAIAGNHSVPIGEDGFTIRRDDKRHTFIDGSYTQPINVFPGYSMPWVFTFHTDTFTVKPVKLNDFV